MNPTESIKLVAPLPWCSHSGKTGFVTEIAPDRLRLKLFEPAQSLQGRESLTVSLPPGDRHYQFEGHAITGDSPLVQEILVTDERLLQDLLGQIRKEQHIELCRTADVESRDRFTGFDRLSFVCYALSELDRSDLDTTTSFLGKVFAAPLLITGMTGGIEKGMVINRNLASAAARLGIPMGIGSQRIALENPEYAKIFDVKRYEPDVFLIGNLGGAQVRSADAVDQYLRAVDMIQADAMAIHLNVVQECVQVEGDRKFSGLLKGIAAIRRHSPVPVIVKEVGCGIDPISARRLVESGVDAIDVGGRGGTSWGYIEGLRSPSSMTHQLGEVFRDWGIPTAYSLAIIREQFPDLPLIATGGIRDGLTVAKACALGAQFTGIGLPLMRAALVSDEAVYETLIGFLRGVEVTMMATGSRTLAQLSERLCLGQPLESEFNNYVNQLSAQGKQPGCANKSDGKGD